MSGSHSFENNSDLSDASQSDTFTRSTSMRHSRRESSLRRHKTVLGPTLDRRQSNQNPLLGDDASSMVVQMIEQKLKTATSQLKKEKKERKKADETLAQLLVQNEKLNQKLSESATKCKKLEKDLKKSQEDLRKYKVQLFLSLA